LRAIGKVTVCELPCNLSVFSFAAVHGSVAGTARTWPGQFSETGAGCGGFFRFTENDGEAIAGNLNPIVHTADAFDPTAQKLPVNETA
jgi:hypothetical protein